jgi:hypothetical protein
VGWLVYRLEDCSGENRYIFQYGAFSSPIPVNLNETYGLTIKWDGSKFIFKFKLPDDGFQYVNEYTPPPPYTYKAPPVTKQKGLSLRRYYDGSFPLEYEGFISISVDEVKTSTTNYLYLPLILMN